MAVETKIKEINEAWAGLRRIAMMRNVKLAVAFFVLNIVDAAVTQIAIGNGGLELNPIMGALLRQPSWVFWWFKISLSLIVILVLLILANKYPRSIHRILTGLVIAMAGVCVFNGMGLWL